MRENTPWSCKRRWSGRQEPEETGETTTRPPDERTRGARAGKHKLREKTQRDREPRQHL